MPRLAEYQEVRAPELELAWEHDFADHVIDLAYSPDGRWVAAAAIGGPIAIFHAETGEQKALLPGHAGGTFTLSWRADSQRLASGGEDGRLRIWDVTAGGHQVEADAGASWVETVRYGHTGDFLATGAGRKLRLWNSRGDLLQTYADHPSTIADIQWQPDDLLFTSACYGQVSTFRTNAAQPVKAFEWKGSILCLAWSPDANYIATGNQDASVHFWYRKTGKDLEMSGYASKVKEVAWDSSSRYLATGGSAVVIIWDCGGKGPAGSRPTQLAGHQSYLSALAYQNRGTLLASGGKEGRVCVWSPKAERLLQCANLPGEITKLVWAPDDQYLVAASSQGKLCVFRRSTD